jgi:pSer/pThr/pTyr-binding forkhead associated (FHA) protein/S1-C subfamily serine protease
MKAQFTVLSGTRAGQTDVFSQAQIGIGRHPQSELKFDPDKDLDVSSRHAAVNLVGDLYVLRDLGSTNGTYVNGKKLVDDHVLTSGEIIRFGLNGPEVQFTAIAAPRTAGPAATDKPSGTVVFGSQPGTAPPPPPPPKLSPEQLRSPRRTPGPGTTQKVRIEVARQTKHLRNTAIGLFGLLVVISGAYLWQAAETGRRLTEQRRVLLGQVDSLMSEIGALAAGSEGLKAALDTAQIQAEALKRQLAATPNDARLINDLRTRLEAAVRQQRTLAGAAQVDAKGIAGANRDAIGMIFVQFPSGRVYTGTGFAVKSDPNGGYVVTNKHVVVDSSGAFATKIGIVFEGTRQNFRADVDKVSDQADLALLRVSVHRGVPVIKGLADSTRSLEMGEPAAVLGFPLGIDIAGGKDWADLGVAATLTLGTVSRVLPDLVQLDSYGAQGSSGSPILDKTGTVIGVLYGGQPGSNGRILYGVPVRYVQELLAP